MLPRQPAQLRGEHSGRIGASSAAAPVGYKGVCKPTSNSRSVFLGQHLRERVDNGSIQRSRMAKWLENKASVEVPVPVEPCFELWADRERIPQWMPWIKSVKVQANDTRLSRWTLSTRQFDRDWEFSWLARNLPPIKNQKICWVSEPGSSLPGVSINNRGEIRFVKKSPSSCLVTLSISYEVPDVLAPFANALTPLVEGIISRDMVRFKDYALQHVNAHAKA